MVGSLQDIIHKLEALYVATDDTFDKTRFGEALVALLDTIDLADDVPTPPEGYERCAECGLPVRLGGSGLCACHEVKR